MFVYYSEDLIATGYTYSNFESNCDSRISTLGYVLIVGGGAISWRNVKQCCIVDRTMEAENVAACEAAKEVAWLKKFLIDLGVMRIEHFLITLFCGNNGVIAQFKEPRNNNKGKHIECKYHLIREIVSRGDAVVAKIASTKNWADSFTKTLPHKTFKSHLEGIYVK